MRTIEKYVADDGKEFGSYKDCELYEAALRENAAGNYLRLYDADGKRIGISGNHLNEVYYVVWDNKAAFDVFEKIWTEEYGYNDNFRFNPETNTGYYMYLNIDGEERWWELSEVKHFISTLQKTLAFMEGA